MSIIGHRAHCGKRALPLAIAMLPPPETCGACRYNRPHRRSCSAHHSAMPSTVHSSRRYLAVLAGLAVAVGIVLYPLASRRSADPCLRRRSPRSSSSWCGPGPAFYLHRSRRCADRIRRRPRAKVRRRKEAFAAVCRGRLRGAGDLRHCQRGGAHRCRRTLSAVGDGRGSIEGQATGHRRGRAPARPARSALDDAAWRPPNPC